MAAIAEPLDVFHKFYMDGKTFIGGAEPSIADIRPAATLEFLAVIDYPLPAWAKDYMAAMEKSLGAAYAEPAAAAISLASSRRRSSGEGNLNRKGRGAPAAARWGVAERVSPLRACRRRLYGPPSRALRQNPSIGVIPEDDPDFLFGSLW
jgi:hypothetical protein